MKLRFGFSRFPNATPKPSSWDSRRASVVLPWFPILKGTRCFHLECSELWVLPAEWPALCIRGEARAVLKVSQQLGADPGLQARVMLSIFCNFQGCSGLLGPLQSSEAFDVSVLYRFFRSRQHFPTPLGWVSSEAGVWEAPHPHSDREDSGAQLRSEWKFVLPSLQSGPAAPWLQKKIMLIQVVGKPPKSNICLFSLIGPFSL